MRFLLLLLLHLPVWAGVTLVLQHAAAPLPQTEDRPTFAAGTLVKTLVRTTPPDSPSTTSFFAPRLRFRTSAGAFEALSLESNPRLQSTLRIPDNLPLGDAEVDVLDTKGTLPPLSIRIVASRPAIYTIGFENRGVAVAYNTDRTSRTSRNGLTNPLQPGQSLSLWTTGLGVVQPADVWVRIGNQRYAVQYAGPTPGSPGVDQINVAIPETAEWAEGCYTPLAIEVGPVLSNMASVTTGRRPEACAHPLGLTPDEMSNLDAGRRVFLGKIAFTSIVSAPFQGSGNSPAYQRNESLRAEFFESSAADWKRAVLQSTERIESGCSFIPQNREEFASGFIATGGSAGDQFTVITPSLQSLTLPTNELFASYSYVWPSKRAALSETLPSSAIGEGDWRFESSGGRLIGPLAVVLQVPPGLRWLNANSLQSVDRTRGTTVLWDPSGYAATDRAQVTLRRIAAPLGPVSGVLCQAPASQGYIVLPAELLTRLEPVSSSGGYPGAVLEVNITRVADAASWFPLSGPAGSSTRVGLGALQYTKTESRAVELR